MPPSNFKLPFEFNEDLWFDDGDICVCARRFDSGVLCLYKLYRDMLAVHSSILLNLLDTSIMRGQVYVGDTPYAYLADHDALDLERFFVAIYYPTYFLFWKHDARSFSRALPVLRIASKYKATSVIEALASQLEEDWPQTISEWDASQCEDGSSSGPFRDFCPDPMRLNRAVMESASAIRVAHIANMPGILPAAYYELSKISSSEAWWQDTVSKLGPTEDRKRGRMRNHGARKTDGKTLLSDDDVRCLALGRERLARYMLDFRKRLSKELVFHARCADAWNTSFVAEESVDILADLLDVCNVIGANMCADCRSKADERGREERVTIWESLPKLFCLPQSRASECSV